MKGKVWQTPQVLNQKIRQFNSRFDNISMEPCVLTVSHNVTNTSDIKQNVNLLFDKNLSNPLTTRISRTVTNSPDYM